MFNVYKLIRKVEIHKQALFDAENDAKTAHYERIQELGLKFKEKYSTFLCRDLLELDIIHDIPVPELRTPEYYKKRKCSLYVEYAASLLDEYIENHGIER
ncbi:C_GCAxxG_C_C family protein [bacterium]|nr:C_GCAxxG_C_C family protein [bacterium]